MCIRDRCYWLKVYEIPEGTKNAKGRAIQNLLNIDSDDVVTAYLRVKNLNGIQSSSGSFSLHAILAPLGKSPPFQGFVQMLISENILETAISSFKA